MNCYNHNDKAAIGICKHCNKGICMDCQCDTGEGIACIGECTENTKSINGLIHYNLKLSKTASNRMLFLGLFYLALGFLFVVIGVVFMKRIDPILVSLGCFLGLYGFYSLFLRK